MKVLVVDDSKMMRLTVSKLLQTIDLETVEAEDGQVALDIVKKDPSDISLLMLDWNMPVMDGLACLKAVRALPECAHIKVIMLTTENQFNSIRTAIAEGADEYIMKPFTEEMVIDKVKMVMAQ